MFRLPLKRQVLFSTKKKCEELGQKPVRNAIREISRSSTALRLNVDANNIMSSPFPDVSGYNKLYIHDFIWEKVDKWPEKTALICSVTGRSYTYKELKQLTGRLAMTLRKSRILPGDTIALVLPNIPEFAIVLLAANEAGLCTTLINPGYSASEIRRQLINSDASAVFTTSSKYDAVKQSIDNNPKIKHPIVVINDDNSAFPSECARFHDLVRDDEEEFFTKEKTSIDFEDTALLPYSSGTTGLSKGVELSHRNIVANIKQVGSKDITFAMEATSSHQEVVPLILPLFHIYGLGVCLYPYLSIGAKLICVPKFTVAEFLNVLKKYRPSVLYVVPPMIQMMAHNENVSPDHVASVKGIVSGAAPFGKESVALFQSRVNADVRLLQGYGLTETSPIVTLSKSGNSEAVGYTIPNTQLRIVGTENGVAKNLGVDEMGELYVKGPQVMKGYYKNPQATADTMDGEWFKTGDLASYDKDGLFYIRGRLKELIKVKGFQVPPAELEEVLRGFPKVQDVAVIGVPHEQFGEIPKAFIVPKEGANLQQEEVKDYVAQRVAKFKQLGYVQFVQSIPKSAAGKILRKELQNL